MKIGSFEHFRALVVTVMGACRAGWVKGLGGLDGMDREHTGWLHEAQQALDAHRAEISKPFLSDADEPSPATWPKACPACPRTFTQEQWNCLEFKGYVGAFMAHGVRYAVQLRQCICANTIGIEVPLPMAKPRELTLGDAVDLVNANTMRNVREAGEACQERIGPTELGDPGPMPSLSAVVTACLKDDPEWHARDCSLPFGHPDKCEPWPF